MRDKNSTVRLIYVGDIINDNKLIYGNKYEVIDPYIDDKCIYDTIYKSSYIILCDMNRIYSVNKKYMISEFEFREKTINEILQE